MSLLQSITLAPALTQEPKLLGMGRGEQCRSSHIHISVRDANVAVLGGHLCEGSVVRTRADVLVASLTQWQLQRAVDSTTGSRALEILPRFTRSLLLSSCELCRRKVIH